MYFSEALNKICIREKNQAILELADNLRSAQTELGQALTGATEAMREFVRAWSYEAIGMMHEAQDIADLKRHAIVLGASLTFFFMVMVTYILILAF